MYECESWTVKKAEHWRIDAFELWCWKRLLRAPWTARRSNQSILKEINPSIHWKDGGWSWSSNTWAMWCEEPTHWKRPWCWEVQFSWIAQSCLILGDLMIAACQASLSMTNSRSLLKLTSIKSVIPSSHLILCRPFLLLPPILTASGSSPMSQLFAWGGQSIGVSASASVPPMNTQDAHTYTYTYTYIHIRNIIFKGFPGGLEVKNSPANARDACSVPELVTSAGEGNGNTL